MTPIEQINWDKQVKSGEMSFGALKAELAEAKKQIEHSYIKWKADLERRTKELLAAQTSEQWWRAKAETYSQRLERAAARLEKQEATETALAEQLAARKVDAEEIERLQAKVDADLSERDHFQSKIADLLSTKKKLEGLLSAKDENIRSLQRRGERLDTMRNAGEIEIEIKRLTTKNEQLEQCASRLYAAGEEVARLKARVNGLIRKARG